MSQNPGQFQRQISPDSSLSDDRAWLGRFDLFKLCEKAMEQININRYDFNLKPDGYDRILKYGIAVHGKSCKVKMAED